MKKIIIMLVLVLTSLVLLGCDKEIEGITYDTCMFLGAEQSDVIYENVTVLETEFTITFTLENPDGNIVSTTYSKPFEIEFVCQDVD